MLRDYETELQQTAETYGRHILQTTGICKVQGLVNRVDLTSDEVLNRITVIVDAVQRISKDESIPWKKENDPFEGQ